MNSSFARILAVTLLAAGSFANVSARPALQASTTASVAPHGNPGGPQIPIPVCPTCGRGGDGN